MENSRMKILFIYNPASGKGKLKTNLHEIINIFTRGGYDVTVYPTQKLGDAMDAVISRTNEEFDLIVCGGGDGTLDEVVKGMIIQKEKTPIGYIPAGSTNDFALSLGIPMDMKKASQNIVDGKVFPCDVGMFNGNPFVYIAAFGLFTEVSYETDQNLKNALGHAAYILEGIKSLSSIKTYPMWLESEGKCVEGEYIYGMVTNSLSVGGFKNITGKEVKLDDGKFEVILVKKPSNLAQLSEIAASILNQKFDAKCIDYFKTSNLKIFCEEEIAWTLDGEYGGKHLDVCIENRQKAIQIVVKKEEKDGKDEK